MEAESIQSAASPSPTGSPRPIVAVDPTCADDPLLVPLDLPAASEAGDAAFLVGMSDGVLDLRPPGEHDRPGIRAVFPPDRGGSGPHPLVRAFGPRIGAIHDCTAGLGGDAYRLARGGHEVVASERVGVVHALVASAWQAARASGAVSSEIAARLAFRAGEAAEAIAGIDAFDQGVYIDPMYPPPRRSSAKPRRALQVLRALLGPDEDSAALVTAARERAARVVVKRPHHAAPLLPGPSHAIESKLVRFDVYVNPDRLSAKRP